MRIVSLKSREILTRKSYRSDALSHCPTAGEEERAGCYRPEELQTRVELVIPVQAVGVDGAKSITGLP